MKIIMVLAICLAASSVHARSFSSGVVTGAVGGAVAATVIAGSSGSKPANTSNLSKRVPVGRTILECRLSHSGECYNMSGKNLLPVYFASAKGYKYIHWQELVSCGDGFCLLMEVSK